MISRAIEIAGRPIGMGAPPYVIAELGINHGGSADMAHQMIDAAVETGADALKLQTFATDQFLATSSPYYNLLRECELPRDALAGLLRHAKESNVTLFSAVFDEGSADIWNNLGAVAYKIASCDLTHLPLLRHVARFGKPMVVSTGGATLAEARTALDTIRSVQPDIQLAFLHCVSNYPAAPSQVNLACMATMRDELGTPIGFSDHTTGNTVPVAAAALGAELIEKHFTLDRNAEGPDHALSADPSEFKAMVEAVRGAWQAVGRAEKEPIEDPATIIAIRRSVTMQVAAKAGTILTRDMLAIKRPGSGIAPDEVEKVVGMTLRRDIEPDHTLVWDDLVVE